MTAHALDLLLVLTKFLGLSVALVALYFWINVVAVYSRLKKVVLRWEKVEFGVLSLALFIIILITLSGSLLCYAFYIRDVGRLSGAEKWLYEFVGLSGLMLLTGLIYIALKLLYIQPISEEGIYKITFQRKSFFFHPELIPWSDIYDYYIRQGEFFSTVTFIMRRGSKYSVEVPTYLVSSLAKLADYSIDKYAFLMRYGKKASKSSRHS